MKPAIPKPMLPRVAPGVEGLYYAESSGVSNGTLAASAAESLCSFARGTVFRLRTNCIDLATEMNPGSRPHSACGSFIVKPLEQRPQLAAFVLIVSHSYHIVRRAVRRAESALRPWYGKIKANGPFAAKSLSARWFL